VSTLVAFRFSFASDDGVTEHEVGVARLACVPRVNEKLFGCGLKIEARVFDVEHKQSPEADVVITAGEFVVDGADQCVTPNFVGSPEDLTELLARFKAWAGIKK
tara:strand:+ start:3066 stop:3377 length:312 start_codon:yes stop_codon:yes gene_type:complete